MGSGFTYDVTYSGDTQIQGWINVSSSAPSQTLTITVTSNGYGGMEFQGAPGQSNQAQTQAQVHGAQNIQLSCPSSVERGNQITCTLSGVPPGATISWRFSGDAIVIGPSSGTQWGGPMVRSGTIQATVNGQPLSVAVSVTPRPWQTPAAQPQQVADGTLSFTLPTPIQLLTGWSEMYLAPNLPAPSGITTGPHSGYVFWVAPFWDGGNSWYRYIIHPDLENALSEFSQHQCGNYNPTTNPYGFISQGTLAQTRRHEYNSSTQSHWIFYANAINSGNLNPDKFLESQVSPPGANVQTFYNEAQMSVEPWPPNFSETGMFLGNVNLANPTYETCN